MRYLAGAASLISSLMVALPASAQEALTLGIGGGLAPRFPGSDSYVPIPFPFVEWTYKGRTLRNNNFGFEFDLTRSDNFDFGPIARIDQGRDDWQSASDPVIEALGQVDASAELGGFIGITRPLITSQSGPPTLFTARVSLVKAIGGHDGLVAEASAGIIKPMDKLSVIATGNVSYASAAFQRSYFTVDAAGSQASGLGQFDASAGFRDVGVTTVLNYRFSPKWSTNSIISYARLVGDAADSPIVSERGSPNQLFFGLNLNYTFK